MNNGHGQMGDEDSHSLGLPGGREVGRRFDLLLARFPRADGEPWRAVEIERETGGEVSSSYISALRRGKFKRPGMRQLSHIADVVGFPFELWRVEPELWDEELAKHPARGGMHGPAPAGGPPPPALRRTPAGEELGRLVDRLFGSKVNPATGAPYTEEEVAARSRRRLTAEEIRAMRRGERRKPPPDLKLIALSDVFDVPLPYWFPDGGEVPEYDIDGLREMFVRGYLIRRKGRDLSPAERNMLELFLAALESNRSGEEQAGPGEEGT